MKLHWNTIPGPTRCLDIQADILTCKGYIIVPILASKVRGDRADHWRLYGPSVLDGEPMYLTPHRSLDAAKRAAQRHYTEHTTRLRRFEDTV